jgi:hypothetical protein
MSSLCTPRSPSAVRRARFRSGGGVTSARRGQKERVPGSKALLPEASVVRSHERGRSRDMSSVIKIVVPMTLAAGMALVGCMAQPEGSDSNGQEGVSLDSGAARELAPGETAALPATTLTTANGCSIPESNAPSYSAPDIQAPTYPAPTFGAPTVNAPTYNAPSYQAPSYQTPSSAPSYTAPVYTAPSYPGPTFEAPVYDAPVYQAPSFPAPVFMAPTYVMPNNLSPAREAPPMCGDP